jgi:hypothetical protein
MVKTCASMGDRTKEAIAEAFHFEPSHDPAPVKSVFSARAYYARLYLVKRLAGDHARTWPQKSDCLFPGLEKIVGM